MAHALQRVRPDFEIVREQEGVGDTLTEGLQYPVMKVSWRLVAIPLDLDQTLDASGEIVRRKMTEVVLEGVGDEFSAEPDVGLAHMVEPRVWESAVHEVIEVTVVRELYVAPEVPSKTLFVFEGGGEAARVRVDLQDLEIGVPKLVQAVGRTEAGTAGTENKKAGGGH